MHEDQDTGTLMHLWPVVVPPRTIAEIFILHSVTNKEIILIFYKTNKRDQLTHGKKNPLF